MNIRCTALSDVVRVHRCLIWENDTQLGCYCVCGVARLRVDNARAGSTRHAALASAPCTFNPCDVFSLSRKTHLPRILGPAYRFFDQVFLQPAIQ